METPKTKIEIPNPKPPRSQRVFRLLRLLNFLVLPAALFVVIFALVSNGSLKKRLESIKSELSRTQQESFTELDKKLERLENLTLKLKEQGYVERDEFRDLSAKILSATVLVTSTKEGITLSPTGEITTTKELDPNGSSGTGFFVSSDGLIATARHVVEAIGADNLLVVLSSGQKLNAKLMAADERADIATIKVEGSNYPALELGHFENLQTGEEIGFAGFALTTGITKPLVYRGVVSAKGTDQNGAQIFSINAFVNRGNSGGPVFSAKTGRVLGVMAARQKDKTSEKIVKLPPNYAPAVTFGGTDPVRLSVELYNKTLDIVGDVSQVGIGIAYSADIIQNLK